jgi:hypothetical protein
MCNWVLMVLVDDRIRPIMGIWSFIICSCLVL